MRRVTLALTAVTFLPGAGPDSFSWPLDPATMAPPPDRAAPPHERNTALSQPPYYPAPGAPAGAFVPPPAVPPPAVPAPAAPTQVAFPGQVQLAPQPQYAPAPQQVAPQQFATGFPNYVSPPPSPPNRTGLYVGLLVLLLTVLFAVVGFLIIA